MHPAMPVEVVRSDIEQHGDVEDGTRHQRELIGGELKHIDAARPERRQPERRRPEIAADRMRQPQPAERMPDQGRRRRFAVGAGDPDESAIRHGFDEQGDVRFRPDTRGIRPDRKRMRPRVEMGDAGAPDQPIQAGRIESLHIAEVPARLLPVVPEVEMRAGRRQGRRRGPAGPSEPHDGYLGAAI